MHTETGLNWGRQYTLKLTAVDQNGQMSPSTQTKIVIKTQPPLTPPPVLTVSSSNEKILLRWKRIPPKNSGGLITKYNIRWRHALPDRDGQLTPDLWYDEPGYGEVRIVLFKFLLNSVLWGRIKIIFTLDYL